MRTHPLEIVRQLHCPFEAKTNPHATEVQGRTLKWMRDFGLVGDCDAHDPLSQVGLLCAKTYPLADVDRLQLVSDFSTIFFLIDDLSEGPENTPATLAKRNQQALAALGGEFPEPRSPQNHHALFELGMRLRAASSPEWMRRFTAHVAAWLASHVWECKNRTSGRTPPIEEYVDMRQFSIGMYFEFALSEITDDFRLSDDFLKHPAVITLAKSANQQIAWANDILTVDKEVRQGDVQNLVLSIRQERKLSLGDATAQAIIMHNRAVESFLGATGRLLTSGTDADVASSYVRALQHWMGGHLRWGFESKRYARAALVQEQAIDAVA
jgi:hypothetical protein